MESLKAKTPAKVVLPRGDLLSRKILDTAALIAKVVGGTLGPGGRPVLIERPEYGILPTVTKDGVTVFKSLGFQDPVSHSLLESARDCASRTATEAGDGTTTTTILYEAILRLTFAYCQAHPEVAPQRVVASIQKTLRDVWRPEIDRLALKGDLSSDEGRRRLLSVAKTSANGDEELARAVLDCYDICGDDGNVTIVDGNGRLPEYRSEKIAGFPIAKGYEHSCERFASSFINRHDLQQVQLEKPGFILYFGRINDFQTILPLMVSLQQMQQVGQLKTPNFCLVATGFSEQVLGNLALNFPAPDSINFVPLLVPNDSPIPNAQRNFLDDLAAVVGGDVFDPVTHPLDDALVEGGFVKLGNIGLNDEDKYDTGGVTLLEIGRYRTTVHGFFDEDQVTERAEVVKAQLEAAGSQLDAEITKVRLGALTGGIARLHVIGASNAEVKERRDRAEDAICAVRGALKDGCLPGGCWTLCRLAKILPNSESGIEDEVLYPALLTPLRVLMENVGATEKEAQDTARAMMESVEFGDPNHADVYDAADGKFVNALEAGILDSLPAVRDALGNAVSIAVQHGTLGAVVVQPRDHQVELTDARDSADFVRNSNLDENEADRRSM